MSNDDHVESEPYLLVIEDDPDAGEAIARYVEPYVTVQVEAAAGGAWERLISKSPPGAVILDESLPRERGTAMFARYRAWERDHGTKPPARILPVLIISGSARSRLAVAPKELRGRFLEKGVANPGPDIMAIAAMVAVRDELDRIMISRARGKPLDAYVREVLDAASWVPRRDLDDVLGLEKSGVRTRITAANRAFRTADYEQMRLLLEPLSVHAKSGRRSGTWSKVHTADDLTIPRDAPRHRRTRS